MTKQEALQIIKSGKNGTQILDLLDKVSTMCEVSTEENEYNDIEFDA